MTVISIVVAALAAATPISLEEVREASRQATTAQLSEIARLRAQEQVALSRSPLLPQIGLSFQGQADVGAAERRIVVNPATGEELLVDVPAYARPGLFLNVSASQSVFDPTLWANLGVANANAEAATAQADEDRLTAELEGIRRFYDLLRAQKTLEVIATRVKSSAELADRAEALFQAGRRRKEDAISARINLSNDRTAMVRQQSVIAQFSAVLGAWVGRPAADMLIAVDPGISAQGGAPVPAFESALEAARAQRPQLKAMEALTKAADQAVSAARGLYLPTIDVGIGYTRVVNDDLAPFFNLAQQHRGGAQLTLRWDIFNGFGTPARVEQARLDERRARLNLEQSRRDIEADLSLRVEQLRLAIEVTQLANENLTLAASNLQLAEARFQEGAGSTLEIRDAQVKHTSAELQLLESRIDTELARAGLERAIGAFGPGAAQ